METSLGRDRVQAVNPNCGKLLSHFVLAVFFPLHVEFTMFNNTQDVCSQIRMKFSLQVLFKGRMRSVFYSAKLNQFINSLHGLKTENPKAQIDD